MIQHARYTRSGPLLFVFAAAVMVNIPACGTDTEHRNFTGGGGGGGGGGGVGASGGSAGAGGSSECTASQCPGMDDTCKTRTCTGQTCGFAYAMAGTSCNQTDTCDGAGVCKSASCNGLPATCGPSSNEDCCTSNVVTGGTYNRSNNAVYPATVSEFRLDRFEITVGRFRKFVEAYPGSKPASGAGAHPLIAGSGWNSAWDTSLAADQAALKTALKCDGYQTWTDAAGSNEHLPQNCLTWFEASAFCAWDGGRLPTEAEWNYAAAGGNEQREYPWSNPPSSTTIDGTYAVYNCLGDGSAAGSCGYPDMLNVGMRSPKGDGKWGQADLGGSMHEWTLDWWQAYPNPCNNCASVDQLANRTLHGGSWSGSAGVLLSAGRDYNTPSARDPHHGARCAR